MSAFKTIGNGKEAFNLTGIRNIMTKDVLRGLSSNLVEQSSRVIHGKNIDYKLMLRTISQSAANSAIGAFIPQAEGIDVHKISNYITTATKSALVGAAIFNQHHSVVKDILSEAAVTLIGETLSEQRLPHFIHDADYPVNTHIPKQKTKESNFVQESSADITYLEAEKKAQGLTDASNDDIFAIKEHDIFQSLSDINYDIDDTHHIVYPKDKLTTPLSTSLYSDIPSTTKPINESSQKFQLDAHHQAETQATSTPEAINHSSDVNNYGDKNSRIFNFFKQINDNPYVEAAAHAQQETVDVFIHPIDTLKNTAKGLYTAVTNPAEAAKALKQAGSDFITADGPGKFETALSFFGTALYGSALGIGSAKLGKIGTSKVKAYQTYRTERNKVPNGGLRGYIERTSKLDLSPISTVAEADFGYLNKAPLTKPQAAVVRRIESAISKHAKPHDFLGVEKELAGIRIPKSSGGYFNHVQEMRNTITHLDKQMFSIENSLKNPMLNSTSRQILSQAHELARETISRMSNSLTSDLGVSIKPLGIRP